MSKSSLSILAKAIASKRGLTQAEAERFITKMFEVANAGLEEDKQLKMRWLGSFKVTAVKDRESVDVNTGERIVIEGRDKITFTPDNILKEIINKPFAQFETVVVNDGVDFSDIDEKFARMEMEEEENLAEQPIPQGEESQELPQLPQEELTHENPEQETSIQPQNASTSMPSRVSSVVQGLSEQVADLNNPDEVTTSEIPSASSGKAVVSSETQSSIAATTLNEENIAIAAMTSNEANNSIVTTTSNEAVTSDDSTSTSISTDDSTSTSIPTQESSEDLDEDEVSTSKHHYVVPRYMVAIIVVFVLCLMGGMCWFAFNYGKMEAQRDHLAVQLDGMKAKAPKKVAAKPKPVATQPEDSVTLALKEKARQDSIRMAASANAVKMAENSEQKQKEDMVEQAKSQNGKDAKNEPMAKVGQSSNKGQGSKIDQKSKLASNKQDVMNSSQFDKDPRVRTGAYRIVGVAKTVTATSGQSLESISKMYLGPGMECYLQALNGKEIKAGQKVRIPKLELKKRK